MIPLVASAIIAVRAVVAAMEFLGTQLKKAA
jgi:hypothetical protein